MHEKRFENVVPRVFISHSHEDDVVGLPLVNDLRAPLGEDAVWYDASGSLHVGDEWWKRIVAEITARDVFIVILSPAAMYSDWVKKEMALALDLSRTMGKHLLPLAYLPCDLSDDWKSIHALSISNPSTNPAAYGSQVATLFDALVDIAYPVSGLADSETGEADDTHASPLALLVRGVRLFLCVVTLIVYWLLIGYTTPSLFPESIVRIAGSDAQVARILGDSASLQLSKVLIIFFSLAADYLWIGWLLSHIPGLSSIFFLPSTTVAFVFVGFCLFSVFYLLGQFQQMRSAGWKYMNISNIRKILEVTVVTGLLGLATELRIFGGAYLLFPVVANVLSLCIFFYNLASLGGAPYGSSFTQATPALQRKLWKHLVDNRRSRIYAERARQKRSKR